MKQLIKQGIKHFLLLAMMLVLNACSEDYSFNFETPEEALTACKSELITLSEKEGAGKKDLVKIINRWIALQDSTISVISGAADSLVNRSLVNSIIIVGDSIRQEINRIAYAEERSLEDVIYIKLNITCDAKRILASDDYKNAIALFENTEDKNLYGSLNETLKEYRKMFAQSDSVKKENDLLIFMEKEDICFRSLLKYRFELKDELIEDLIEKTERFFDRLQYGIAMEDNEVTRRLLTYLSVRVNHRMVMHAEVCAEDIENKEKISDTAKEEYRWVLLQPFLSLDKRMTTYLTSEQKDVLTDIGKNLPQLLNYLDNPGMKLKKKEVEKLSKIVANTLLSSTLKQNL